MHRRAFAAAMLSLPATRLWARTYDPVFAKGGIAIGGIDPVAYFTDGAPVQGSAKLALKWGGAVWRFASAEHLAMFEADPRKLAPRYGGYCAYAMTEGQVTKSVPEAWTIHEGRLYLTASLERRKMWERDLAGNIAKADSHWPQALG